MNGDKQIQKAGDNAQQMQAGTMVVNNYFEGITEQRAREIASEQIEYALRIQAAEALERATERINHFMDRLFPRLKTIENTLQSFAEPAFLFQLRDAQKAAAGTEQKDDYDLLTELLVCHIQKGKDRKNSAAIHRALNIICEIDNDALCGLTVIHAFFHYFPLAETCEKCLTILDQMFNKLMYQDLPTEKGWMDSLDILGAVRISILGFMKSRILVDYYSKMLNGIVCAGIKKDSSDYNRAIKILDDYGIEESFFIQNDLLDGYCRLPVSNDDSLDHLLVGTDKIPVHLTPEQKQAIKQIMRMYDNNLSLEKEVKEQFVKKWDCFDSLCKFRQWWENDSSAFEITSVGRVLAQVNAKRCDPNIPDLI